MIEKDRDLGSTISPALRCWGLQNAEESPTSFRKSSHYLRRKKIDIFSDMWQVILSNFQNYIFGKRPS